MGQENVRFRNPFDVPGNTLIHKPDDTQARRAKEWARAMSQPSAGLWTRLTHELPLDFAENTASNWFGEDPKEDNRKALLERYKQSQATGKPLDTETQDAWTKLLERGEY